MATVRKLKRARDAIATIRDVAALADVSTATVSNVLSGSRYVGPERRGRVKEAIDQLGYRPNGIAASLRSQRTRIIGIVVPDITNSFFAGVVQRVEQLAAGSGYQIILVSSNEDPELENERINALLSRRVDGLIVLPVGDAFEMLAEIRAQGVDTVVVDRAGDLDDIDTIAADNNSAAQEGTRHLVDLGHRDIALVVSSTDLGNIQERIAGYRAALAEAGLGDRARVVAGGITVASNRVAVTECLSRRPRPTALFAATNIVALGAIHAIRDLNLEFPEEISLLGFDDFEWMTVLKPYVSSIRQPTEEMAALAWSLLTDRLAGKRDTVARLRLPCTLCARESTVRLPSGRGQVDPRRPAERIGGAASPPGRQGGGGKHHRRAAGRRG
ncbi:MAG: LacI family DNA-binding transcriptional regulator [Alphaproteobacteria bacterium]